jgi:hypothetical protein
VTGHRRQQPEAELQAAVFQHWQLRGAPNTFLFHVPNGGSRNLLEAVKLKRLGTVAGVPDFIGIKDGRAYGLELKARRGRLSEAQRVAHEALRAAGVEVATCDTIDDALHQLEVWGMLRGKTAIAGCDAEKRVDNLLSAAHQICWNVGRHDVAIRLIGALNALRKVTPVRPLDNRDEHERDLDEEAFAQGTKPLPS